MEQNIIATVDGMGLAEAKNDRATFTLSIKSKSETLDFAKSQVKERTAQVVRELENRKMPLDGEIFVSTSNYKLEHREGAEKYPAGYQSVSAITWTIVIDDTLDDLYQTCLKIDPSMPTPTFSVKDRDVLLEEALQKAADDVKSKFKKECDLLEVSSENLQILKWHFGYGAASSPTFTYAASALGATGPQGAQGSPGVMGPGGYQASVMKLGSIYQELLDTKLNPGFVSVRVSVQVNYVWKEYK